MQNKSPTTALPIIAIIVQARMGSKRLPGKQLKSVLDRPLIAFLLERLQRVQHPHLLILATTTSPLDDELAAWCQHHQIACFRGPEEDVLERFYQAARFYQADVIVRICGDCPLLDPAVIDEALNVFFSAKADFVSNVIARTFPRGMDVEVFSFKALKIAAKEARSPEEREHVTPYLYKHADLFLTQSVTYSQNASHYRWTVDTAADLQLITLLLENLFPVYPQFTLQNLLQCAEEHPEWQKINTHIQQKTLELPVDEAFSLQLVRPIPLHAKLILTWRNDDLTRHASFHQQAKQWAPFYTQFIKEFFCFAHLPPLFVIEKGQPVAFLRFEPLSSPTDVSLKCCKISINVAPAARGRGVGLQSLLLAKEFLRVQKLDEVYAEVKPDNQASLTIFKKAGFLSLPSGEVTVFDTGEKVAIERLHMRLSTKAAYQRQPVYIIAEAGSNWRVGKGALDFTIAKQMIEAAAAAGANAVKFQIFQPAAIYVANAGQSDYLAEAGVKEDISDLFENLVLPHEMIPTLAKWAQAAGIDFLATPFSPSDFWAVDAYVTRHKIASYEIGYQKLIELVAKSGKPLLLSTGAATEEEIAWAVDTFWQHGGQHLTLLQCTAAYPATPESLNLRAIKWLAERFTVDAGLSDHSLHPLSAPLGAVALGATVIEKHFTLDRCYEGPDHAFAVIPSELAQMVKVVRELEQMLGSESKTVHAVENELRLFARRGIQAITNILPGELLEEGKNIAVLRPGQRILGIHPLFITKLQGRPALRAITMGNGIQHGDF